jgi:adhesin transport system outer membrane protein
MTAVAVLLATTAFAQTQPPISARDAARIAIESNPEVQLQWNQFLAARDEKDASRGYLLPRLDLAMDAGRHLVDEPGARNLDFRQRGGSLTLTQLLFDGGVQLNDVRRLGAQAQSRYFQFLDAAQNTAFEAVRAYVDVVRYRELVRLARLNREKHATLLSQIQDRVNAGAGRRADLEQATGRLALADSNLITEEANLHDVEVRYQRFVGSLPPATVVAPAPVSENIDPDVNHVLQSALARNPALMAASLNVKAAEATVRGAKERYAPRVDFRAVRDWHLNDEFGVGPARTGRVEVVLSMNLFKGGTDAATVRQQANLLIAAQDLRDKTCRDTRQTLAIAHNDVMRLRRQLDYLQQHQRSTALVREAYRQQFDINQRSLLDLLDTENELFQAQRAFVSATWDLDVAYARVHMLTGELLDQLGVTREGIAAKPEDVQGVAGVEPLEACVAESVASQH